MSVSRSKLAFAPRVLRFKEAPAYLGMDRNRFNAEVRPFVTEIPIGKQGIGFDRLELDAWFENYRNRNGRPLEKGEETWDAKDRLASSSGPGRGTSTSALKAGGFARVLEQLTSKKRSESSQG